MSNEDGFVKLYSNTRNFREKVRNEYKVSNSLLYDDKVLLMIYAWEWFKIPKSNKFELVSYHPFLKQKDLDLITHLSIKYASMAFIPALCFFMFGLRMFSKRYNKKDKLIIFSMFHLITSNVLGFVLWKCFFYNKLNTEIENTKKFKKYLVLDVDKEKIKDDLKKYNIKLI
jgi:hypothetical protein